MPSQAGLDEPALAGVVGAEGRLAGVAAGQASLAGAQVQRRGRSLASSQCREALAWSSEDFGGESRSACSRDRGRLGRHGRPDEVAKHSPAAGHDDESADQQRRARTVPQRFSRMMYRGYGFDGNWEVVEITGRGRRRGRRRSEVRGSNVVKPFEFGRPSGAAGRCDEEQVVAGGPERGRGCRGRSEEDGVGGVDRYCSKTRTHEWPTPIDVDHSNRGLAVISPGSVITIAGK